MEATLESETQWPTKPQEIGERKWVCDDLPQSFVVLRRPLTPAWSVR